MLRRSVAQPGSAPVLGTGGRRFESSRSDHFQSQLSMLVVRLLDVVYANTILANGEISCVEPPWQPIERHETVFDG